MHELYYLGSMHASVLRESSAAMTLFREGPCCIAAAGAGAPTMCCATVRRTVRETRKHAYVDETPSEET